jgi:hypothetical protein
VLKKVFGIGFLDGCGSQDVVNACPTKIHSDEIWRVVIDSKINIRASVIYPHTYCKFLGWLYLIFYSKVEFVKIGVRV